MLHPFKGTFLFLAVLVTHCGSGQQLCVPDLLQMYTLLLTKHGRWNKHNVRSLHDEESSICMQMLLPPKHTFRSAVWEKLAMQQPSAGCDASYNS